MSLDKPLNWKTTWANDDLQPALPFWQRREFILTLAIILFGLALYMPRLGSYALWDPWEPHYSQVAMEMNQHADWLVPHYRNGSRWFSKPILLLWGLKASFLAFGQTEWAARFPIVLITIFGLAMINILVGRIFNWKTGLIASLVLATSPQFFFIARQTIFDMPYVVFQTIAILFLIGSLFTYPDRPRWIYAFWVFSALAMLSKGLLAVVIPAVAVGTFILITWDWRILARMRFGRGLAIFFIIAAPWFIFMTAKFGSAYPERFFIYHHFERAAGMIKKPNHTFDLYVQQLFYAAFPWSAFLPIALVRFLKLNTEDITGKTRKNLLLWLSFAMPYIFFTLSSTKFNHYIFPVIPFAAIMVAYYIVDRLEKIQRPIVRFEIILITFIFGILAKDIVTNYSHLIHLFIYYYDRALPRDVLPQTAFYILFIPMGVFIGLPMIWKRISHWQMGGLILFASAFALYCNAVLMPQLADTFSQKILWEAYLKAGTGTEPICEYHSWERRSVSYYANNKTVYINSRKSGSEKNFFKRPGKLFCMVDRNIYSQFRRKVKSSSGRELYIVNSEHPFTYLVATEPPKGAEKTKGKFILKNPPPIRNNLKANWEDKIQLLGWETNKEEYKPGDKITITLLFEVQDVIDDDYQIFIHGDPFMAEGRFIGDHAPADGKHPTDRWQPGQIIKDTYTTIIPKWLASGKLTMYVGFFSGKKRLEVTAGPDDGENRVKLGYLQINN